MDKERARFVLRSFRPEGADADDADFAEALRLATSDRELGQWLVRERAFDADFAEALARVDLPGGLREDILLAMVQDDRDVRGPDPEEEAAMIRAMAAIKVPDGLRERVMDSMERSAARPTAVPFFNRFALPLAAAAGVAFAFILMTRDGPEEVKVLADQGIPVEAVQAGFIRTFESPIFSLDETGHDAGHLVSFLKGKGLPCGDGMIPPGLRGVKGLGCRELEIDGKKGSLICFDEKNGTVHLIIFKREDVDGDLPGIASPVIEQEGDWAKAKWEKGAYAFCLMGMRESEKLARFF